MTERLDPGFVAALDRLVAASGGKITVTSGYRSVATQQALWDAALRKYGSPQAARRWVAPPGNSKHNQGIAADLGGDLALAHRLAPSYGLYFPMSWEPWHVEPLGSRNGPEPQASTTPPPGAETNYATDPNYRAAVVMKLVAGALPSDLTAATTSGSTATTSSSTTTGSATPSGGFADDLIAALGVPDTAENARAIRAWMTAEGTKAAFNPLATTQPSQGATDFNRVGVKNYTTYQQGLQATVQTLRNGRYTNILAALARGDDAMAVADAIALSPWGTGSGVRRVLGGR